MELTLRRIGIEITHPKQTFTAMLLVPVIFLTCGWACNVQSTVNTINTILTDVGPALQLILNLLPLLGAKNIPENVITGIDNWVPEVTQDVTQIEALVQQYQNDLSNAAFQAKLNALIQTTENSVASILSIIHVLDPATRAKITEMVNVVGAAIISVENLVNQFSGKKLKSLGRAATIKNGADFKAKFNAVLHAPTSDPVVDAATEKLNLD